MSVGFCSTLSLHCHVSLSQARLFPHESIISHSLHKDVVDGFITVCIDPDDSNDFVWRLE